MSDELRGRLNQELTRKQFLQYMAGALLMVFGLNNFIALLTGRSAQHVFIHDNKRAGNGFGSSRFGV